MTADPGLAHQARYRTLFRVAGGVLVPAGILVLVYGLVHVFGYDGYDAPRARYVVAFLGGLPLIGLGLMCLNVGFLGAAARFGAGETMPVLRDSASYLSGGEGVLGVGRTADEAGPFCTTCGARNDGDANFCNACGSPVG